MKKVLEAYEIFEYVRDIHKKWDDFDDGDLERRIYAFSKFVLGKLPVDKLFRESRWNIDDSKVDKYSKMSTVIPPIIYDRVSNEIIDGAHRVATAKKLGIKYIDAYLGTRTNFLGYEDTDN